MTLLKKWNQPKRKTVILVNFRKKPIAADFDQQKLNHLLKDLYFNKPIIKLYKDESN